MLFKGTQENFFSCPKGKFFPILRSEDKGCAPCSVTGGAEYMAILFAKKVRGD
jgi:hypothetical protein